MNLTLKQYLEGIQSGKFSAEEVTKQYLEKAKKENEKYFAFVRFHEEYVNNNLESFKSRPLKGAPIGVKDIFLTKGYETTFGSNIGKGFIPGYSATSFERLENAGGLMIGKTNMDEFAMGSSTESSAFGRTINPYGQNRIPGGSSGGSAVSVAADLCLGALGTDTGGSIRQPASLCNIVGMKGTYGRVSRYGVQSMASSFDHIGVFTKTVEDSKILLSSIAGLDPKDATTCKLSDDISSWDKVFDNIDISNYRIALPKEFIGEGLDSKIKEEFLKVVALLRKHGAKVDEISLPVLNVGLSVYYTLMPAEVSTNLARFDGIKFGLQKDTMEYDSISDYYKDVRSQGFGEEVKRRILLGTFVLSSANYEGYYVRAQKVKELLKSELNKVFSQYDIIISPTSPELAWKLGEKSDDPLKMYLADLYTVTANLAGIPGISIPAGMIQEGQESLPRGVQLMSQSRREDNIFAVGNWLEKALSL